MRYRYQKLILFLCVWMLVVGAIGCGSAKEPSNDSGETAIDMNALQTAMLEADTTLPEMKVATSGDEQGELNFTAFTDFAYERVQSYFYAYAADGGSQEIAVVELKDAGDAAALMNTLKEHLKLRSGALGEYAPDQLSMIEHAVIKQRGRYVAMIICEKSGLVQQAFEKM